MGQAESKSHLFWRLCGLGKLHLAKQVYDRGNVNVNWVCFDGKSTALLVASANGHQAVVEYLLINGADITARDERENTALHHAAIRGYSELCLRLLDAGMSVNAVDKEDWSPLMNSCYWSQPNVVAMLLEHGADLSHKNRHDRTALHEVCRSPSPKEDELAEILCMLVDAGADVNMASKNREDDGFTPLMYAAYHGHASVALVLIESQCDLNATDSNGWTALHWAADRGRKEIVQLLLDKNCDAAIQGNREQLAIDRATDDEIRQMIEAKTTPYSGGEDDDENASH